ncbi:ABC transporter substrate-binding protein [Alkalihalophilus sp. As8PL]|uniref:ABC transporter substrate-binding protein n=1 Tax=Alkalihalophilus sp. As8PL TaxID=3237103 RepID=A0AB39BS58_9BACI
MRKIKLRIIYSIVILLLVVACGGTQEANLSNEQVENNSSEKTEQTQDTYEAVKIKNNDHVMVFTEVPKRAVSLNQHVTEIMLALGLEENMVGSAYLDDEILPEYKEAYEQIEVLSNQYPSQEVFLAKEPDFAYAGWGSAFREDNIGTVDQLNELDINAYLHESSTVVGPTIDHIYQDIRNIATIFNVVDRGEELIGQIVEDLSNTQAEIPEGQKTLRVFVFDSGVTAPFTVGQNFLNTIISMAGAENIFNDIDSNWGEVSWEEVVERDPEVIVIMDYGETTAEEKREQLLNHPALTDVTAIMDEHFIVIPLSAAAEGIRVPLALEILVSGLYEEG